MFDVQLNIISSLIATAVGIVALYSFTRDKHKLATDEGRKMQEIDQIKVDLAAAHRRIEKLKVETNCTHDDLIEVKADVKHILAAINRLEAKVNEKK